jgi:hypothetical protein
MVMKHIISRDLHYHANTPFPGCVKLDVFQDTEYGYHWVVFTEKEGNKGKSVTNSVEDLMAIVLELYDYNPDFVMWVERYEYKPAELDNIYFKKGSNEPQWRPVKMIPGEGESRYQMLLDGLNVKATHVRSIDDEWEPPW